MDHAQLISELPDIERLPPVERIALAKERRRLQLLRNHEYDLRTPDPLNRRARLKFSSGIALLEATSRGDYFEVQRLLQDGSDPNSHNEDGLTPLHQCAIDNNEQLVLLLIKYGANVNATDTELWTPLHAAACCGYINIVRILIDNDADLLAVNTEGNMPYDICDDENTLDAIESAMAYRGITQQLIDEKRAEPEKQMLADMKALHQQHGEGYLRLLRLPDGSNYLHAAGANGYYDVVAFLLRVNVSPKDCDLDGWTPLHAAAQWNQPDIVEMLCEYGADINAKTNSGETPLDLAEDAQTKTVIQMIQQQEARKKRLAFGVRDSRRQSRRRKKYESPQAIAAANADNPLSARGTIRRQSIRDRSGLTPARLEAQQEQSNLIRSYSREDVAKPDDGSGTTGRGGAGPSRESPNKTRLKSGQQKSKPMSPDEWVKKLEAEMNDDDADADENAFNRGGRGRSGSRKKKKPGTPVNLAGDHHELTDMRGNGSGFNSSVGPKDSSFGDDRGKKGCCCSIL